VALQIAIGVSACLLGEKVRYDGGHKHDSYITGTLGTFFRLVPVCPEVECGMPIPREAMRLVGSPENPRLITVRSGVDKTGQMLEFSERKVRELEREKLSGFIFKKNSPSSGLYRVKVYQDGQPARNGSGLFAAAVVRHFPLLPVEEEGRLNDPQLRENFLERVFAFHRWNCFLADKPEAGKLVAFHTAHKLLMMAHSPAIYREMGKVVAAAGKNAGADLFTAYGELLMRGLALHATPKKNANVLMHIMGYFKKQLSAVEKAELLAIIDQYRNRLVPLIVPITLLRHYVMKYEQHYLQGQVYLSPHPAELMLRNHV